VSIRPIRINDGQKKILERKKLYTAQNILFEISCQNGCSNYLQFSTFNKKMIIIIFVEINNSLAHQHALECKKTE
jgi:hypothetical protein